VPEAAFSGMAQITHLRGPLPWIGAGLLLVAIGVAWYLLPVGDRLDALRGWIVGHGVAGALIFAAIYVIATVFLAPGWVLTLAAGFAYGFWGLPIVLVAATIGASLAFLISRFVARETVRRLLESRRTLGAIDNAVAETVLLLRLSPLIPFNLQNYLFGATAVPFTHYIGATFAGIVPGTALYIYLGALGNGAGNGGPAEWALFGGGLLATIFVVILIARKARAKLRRAGVGDRPT